MDVWPMLPCAARGRPYSSSLLTFQGSSFLSQEQTPPGPPYGHVPSLSQDRDREEAAKGRSVSHLSSSRHPRTCKKLWATATRWTRGLRASLVGVGLPQTLRVSAPPGTDPGCPSALFCSVGIWGYTLSNPI